MADTPPSPLEKPDIQGIILPKIDSEGAKALACEWIESQNFFSRKDTYRMGKAVMVYYPFWEFIREDGAETKTFYRPACGTLMTDLQKIRREKPPADAVPDDLAALPVTISASYYYPDIHGIPRGERLVAIPFWLISYKMGKSIYMLKIDAETGDALPEWHPYKESVNWRRIAVVSFVPLLIISFLGAFIHPVFFILDVAAVIFLLYRSRMFALINAKREEGENGS